MRLQFLGTGAAEGFPGAFCECDNCRGARALGGRSLRTRSSLLVNGDLLIDPGPDTVSQAQRFGLSLHGLTAFLVTHGHVDHFHWPNIECRGTGFVAGPRPPNAKLFAPADVVESILARFPDLDDVALSPQAVAPFQQWGFGRYEVRSYLANHLNRGAMCLFYSVSDGASHFLYAADTGPFPPETWEALAQQAFDLAIIEETMGYDVYPRHMNLASVAEHVHRLREIAALRTGARTFISHISHDSNPTHDRLAALMAPHDVEVAFDGLVIEI